MWKKFKVYIRSIVYPPGATPLRWKEMSILLVCLIGTAMTISMLFPYLPAMVKAFGESDQEAGYSAGLIASAMFAGRGISSYFWGWLSDKVGRRPVIMSGLLLMSVSTMMFGFSESVTWAIVTRFSVGLSNGVLGTAKTVIPEICDDSNQALGVTMVTIAWTTGLVLGPAIGGYLAEPAVKFPSTFPKGSFFDRFAFLMPNIINTVFLMVGCLAVYFGLEETLQKRGNAYHVDEAEELVKRDSISTNKTGNNDKEAETAENCQATSARCSDKDVQESDEMVELLGGSGVEHMPKRLEGDDISGTEDFEPSDALATTENKDDEASIPKENNLTSLPESSNKKCERISTTNVDDQLSDTNCVHLLNTEKQNKSKVTSQSSTSKSYEVHSTCNGCGCSSNGDEVLSKENGKSCEAKSKSKHRQASRAERQSSSRLFCCTRGTGKITCCSGSNQSNFAKILRDRNAVISIFTYSIYSFAIIGCDELFNLWVATEPYSGGLGFSTNQIGTVLLIAGVILTLMQPTVLPKVERKVGAIMTFQISALIVMFCTVVMPCIRASYNRPTVLWSFLMVVVLPLRMCTTGGFLATFLLINNSVTPDMLGTTNGLAMAITSVFRAFAPTVGGSLYAWSISSGYKIGFPFNVNLAFVFFGMVLLFSIGLSCFLSHDINKQKVVKSIVKVTRTKDSEKSEVRV